MVTGEIIFKERGELFGLTLQEDETADGGFLCLHHSFTGRLAFLVCRAVNKTIWYVLPFGPEGFQFFLETLHKIMAKKDVTPRCFLFAFGYDFYSWSRIFISLNYVYALWQTLALARVYVGCRRRMRAILRHFLYLFYVTAGISHLWWRCRYYIDNVHKINTLYSICERYIEYKVCKPTVCRLHIFVPIMWPFVHISFPLLLKKSS